MTEPGNGARAAGAHRLGVVSGGDQIRLRSYLNHYIWASENDLPYHLEIGLAPGQRLPYDVKYTIIRRILPLYEWVLWVDDDVFFTNFSAGGVRQLIDDAARDDAFLVIAEGPMEPTGIWSRINSGVMLLRNDLRTFALLAEAEATDIDALREIWDFEANGLFSGGDQDALWRAINGDQQLRDGTKIVGHAQLNSRPHLLDGPLNDVLNLHFCGPDKPARIAAFARSNGLGTELVPRELLAKYSAGTPTPGRLSTVLTGMASRRARHVSDRVVRKLRFVAKERRWR